MGKCGSKSRSAAMECPVPAEKRPRISLFSLSHSSPRQDGADVSKATPTPRQVADLPCIVRSLHLLSEQDRQMAFLGGSISKPTCKATMIIDNQCAIETHYLVEKKPLQTGSHGPVFKASHILSGEVRAVKTICKSRSKHLHHVNQEIAILKQMDHPSIVRLYETFENSRAVSLVMELCSGGPLVSRIADAGHFSEVQASVVMHQVLNAVHYMHVSNSICHRDLKLDSVFFADQDCIEHSAVKLADFGFAKVFRKGEMMTTRVGSVLQYMSPQVLAGRYDQSCDSWSMGVMTYVLLCGSPLFYGENELEVLAKLKKGSLPFEAPAWANVSQGAIDLILKLMKMDSQSRWTPQQALSHAWIKDRAPQAAHFTLHSGFIDHLRCFGGTNDLKKTALCVIAGQHQEEMKMIRGIFMALDLNGDGSLTVEEMRNAMRQAGSDELPEDFDEIMVTLASHKSGGIDYTKFLAASIEKRHYLKESVCWKAFNVFDRDYDGRISQEELTQILNSGFFQDEVGLEAVEQLMKDFDINGDDALDFEEFMLMMLRSCSPRRGNCQTLGGMKARRGGLTPK